MANTIVEMMRAEIRRMVGEMFAENLSQATAADNDGNTGRQPTRRRTRRRPRPAVGYHLNVDKRTAKAALANLAHNPATVLAEIIRQPGQTNRELTVGLADEIPAGKKAIESALDQLRTTDANGERIDRENKRAMKHALVVSKPLE